MRQNPTLETIAQDLFDDEWSRVVRAGGRYRRVTDADRESCSLRWLLPELVQLTIENHDQPVDDLRPMVRRLIAEQKFVDDAGDPLVDTCRSEAVELYVMLFMRVLDRLREQAPDHGTWSQLPVTPQMFG